MKFRRTFNSSRFLTSGLAVGLMLGAGLAALSSPRKPPEFTAATATDSSTTDPSSAIGSTPVPAAKAFAADTNAKAPAAKADKTNISDQRQERLRQVADDFDAAATRVSIKPR